MYEPRTFDHAMAQWDNLTPSARRWYEREAAFNRAVAEWDALHPSVKVQYGRRVAPAPAVSQREIDRMERDMWRMEQEADRLDDLRAAASKYRLETGRRPPVPDGRTCPIHAEFFDGEDVGACPRCAAFLRRERLL